MDIQEVGCGVRTGSTWLRIDTDSDRHIKIQFHNFQSSTIYHKQHMTTCFDPCWPFSSLFHLTYSFFWDLTQRILVFTDVSL
jgi:hypothetical protein